MTKRMFSMQPDFVDARTDVTPDARLEISAPVGEPSHFRVKNIRPDVAKIQEALNRFPVRDGGPQPALKVDSIVGPLTIAAIKRF